MLGPYSTEGVEPSNYSNPHSHESSSAVPMGTRVAGRVSSESHGVPWLEAISAPPVWGKISRLAYPYPSVKVWGPWNLEMEDMSCLGPDVNCYCVDKVVLCAGATVSQYSFLCTASHDYRLPNRPMTTAPITIGQRAWVAADAFIGPGVRIGEGAIVGARASVFRDVDPWTVVGGNPARKIRTYQPEAGR